MKKSQQILLVLIAIVFFAEPCAAQEGDMRFRQISPPGGFTLDGIKSIAKDELGCMWMGTSQGLIKYGSLGAKWFVPVKDDSLSLSGKVVNNIYCDADNLLWVSTDRGLCRFIREQQKFERMSYTYEDGSKRESKVLAMLKTEDGRILIIDNRYFGVLDLSSGRFARIRKDLIKSPTELYKDNEGRVWVGTLNGDVFLFLPSENDASKIISRHSNKVKINSIYSENEQIWIGTEGEGVKLYNLDGELLKRIALPGHFPSSRKGNVRVIKKDTHGRFWFGAYEGLYMVGDHKTTRFIPDYYPGLPHNSIYEIFEDEQGGLWFGTWSGGVALIHHSDNNFQTFRHSLTHNSISDNMISSFLQMNENELLIGTEVGGLNSYNLNTGKFDIVRLSEDEEILNIKTLCKDKQGGIWVGTFRRGLFYKPPNREKFKHFGKGPDDGRHISSSSVYSLCAVDTGVWIGTFQNGINFYSFKSRTIRHCFRDNSSGIPMSRLMVSNILSDSKSNLWLGASSGILYKIQMTSGHISQYATEEKIDMVNSKEYPYHLDRNSIFHLWEDEQGDIWCATNNKGVLRFQPDSGHFTPVDIAGLPADKSAYGIIEGQHDEMWITSGIGLIAYDRETGTARHFDYFDGIQSNLFSPHAVLKDHRGNLYFGGTNGFTRIAPHTIKLNSRKPFTLINELSTPNDKSIYPLRSQGFEFSSVVLGPEETTFEINFSSDNYLMPEKNKYKYRLLNFYDEWIDNKDGEVLFTGLDAGEYVFEVKSCNNDGIWSDAPSQMRIKIRKHWYQTSYAYIAYFLMFLVFLYFIGRFFLERTKLKRAVMLEKTQRENEEQMHEMKLKFFTNISHEFRTPLTLISWPLKRLLLADNITNVQREELEVANRNSNRLLQLINQIIDLRKLEKEKSKLNISLVDVIDFINELQKDFSLEAKSRSIDFCFVPPQNSLEIEADPEKLDAILYNLLSNAYKHVSDKGRITVTVNKKTTDADKSYSNQLSFGEIRVDDFIEIAIEDSGEGIDNEDLLRIFTRFEQGKPSSKKDTLPLKRGGIGLAMCKDFTLLHHGKITVQSDLGRGSRFAVLLPSKQKAQKVLFESHRKIKNLNIEENSAPETTAEKETEKATRILIVEDNFDFRKFISRFLSRFYTVQSAPNGKEALQILENHNIDLVVSDVMMPEMDGFELCAIIKTQLETSHIPIVLLTALSSSENLIAGLDKGADAYLTKPFEEAALKKQIENILQQRKRIQENFSKQFISHKTLEVSSLDNFFLDRVQKAVERNILDENFSMDFLADELMVSRSHLYRKIKSLSGLTSSDFVNMIRVKKAVELLVKKQYRFNEVAFQVGFNSQPYFNKCFKKVYGTTPKKYLERLEEEGLALKENTEENL